MPSSDRMAASLIIVLALILRAALALHNQSHVDGDEAVIGIIARDIGATGVHPLYLYGQPYNGGASIEAHLASLLFPVFGAHPITLKAAALALSIAALAATYGAARSIFGGGTALLAALLFALSPALTVWNLKLRGGYQIIMILSILLFALSVRIFHGRDRGWAPSLLLGFLGGLGLWNLELIFPLVFVIAALWAAAAIRGDGARPRALLVLPGFLVGYSPALYFNLTHHLANWAYLTGGGAGVLEALGRLREVPRALLLDLPRSFDPNAEWQALSWNGSVAYREGISVADWAGYLIALASVLLLRPRRGPRLLLLLLFGAFILFYSVGRPTYLPTPRYFLALYPLLPLAVARSLVSLYTRGGWAGKGAAAASAVFLTAWGLYSAVARIPEEPVVYDAGITEIGPPQRVGYYPTRGEALTRVVSLLEEKGVRAAYAPYYLKYRLIFESGGNVVASARPFEREPRDTGFDARAARAPRFAFVFYLGSPYDRVIRAALEREGLAFFHRTEDGLSLYIPDDCSLTRKRILDKMVRGG